MSILLSRADLDFLLYDWLHVDDLTARERYAEHSRETFDATLDLAEAIATEHFLPHNKKADANEPRFENGKVVMIPEVGEALKHYCEAGLLAAQADAEDGGMQLPCTLGSAAFAFFKAANTGTAAYAMLTTAAANLLHRHGTPEQVARFVGPYQDVDLRRRARALRDDRPHGARQNSRWICGFARHLAFCRAEASRRRQWRGRRAQ